MRNSLFRELFLVLGFIAAYQMENSVLSAPQQITRIKLTDTNPHQNQEGPVLMSPSLVNDDGSEIDVDIVPGEIYVGETFTFTCTAPDVSEADGTNLVVSGRLTSNVASRRVPFGIESVDSSLPASVDVNVNSNGISFTARLNEPLPASGSDFEIILTSQGMVEGTYNGLCEISGENFAKQGSTITQIVVKNIY